jgi:hypothetical protein
MHLHRSCAVAGHASRGVRSLRRRRTYLAKIPREDTRDNTIRLKVSGDGETLDLIGPHEACNDTFTPVPTRTYPRIDDIKIRKNGTFKGSRTYEAASDTGAVIYMWEVSVSGRFVSKKKAKGNARLAHAARRPALGRGRHRLQREHG